MIPDVLFRVSVLLFNDGNDSANEKYVSRTISRRSRHRCHMLREILYRLYSTGCKRSSAECAENDFTMVINDAENDGW